MAKREYWIRSPSKDRKSFRIYERNNGKGGKPVKDSRVDAANAAIKSGGMDLETTNSEIKKIRDELQAPQQKERYPIAEVNHDLF